MSVLRGTLVSWVGPSMEARPIPVERGAADGHVPRIVDHGHGRRDVPVLLFRSLLFPETDGLGFLRVSSLRLRVRARACFELLPC